MSEPLDFGAFTDAFCQTGLKKEDVQTALRDLLAGQGDDPDDYEFAPVSECGHSSSSTFFARRRGGGSHPGQRTYVLKLGDNEDLKREQQNYERVQGLSSLITPIIGHEPIGDSQRGVLLYRDVMDFLKCKRRGARVRSLGA